MAKAIKDVTFVVDRSGSMQSCKEQVIDGYNQFLADLQSQSDLEIRLTLTLFNTEVKIEHEGAHVAEVPKLDGSSYTPDGCTALYDALGQSIRALERRWKGNTDPTILVVVMTDGQENSSREFSKQAIRALIEECEKQPNWTFVYLGAGHDAWAEASQIGFAWSNTQNYASGSEQKTIGAVSASTRNLFESGMTKSGDFFHQGSGTPPTATPPPPLIVEPPKKSGNPFVKPDPTRK